MITKITTAHKATKGTAIATYFDDATAVAFKNGETIINSFDESDGVHFIKQGFVKACSSSQDGHVNLLLIHKAGEFIPLPWALDGNRTTSLSYVAVGDAMVAKSSKDKLRTAMSSNIMLTQEILNQAVNVIAIYAQRIQTLEFRSARGRVIAELLFLAERFGRHAGSKIIITAPITHQDIADSINMTRETASRAIESLFVEELLAQANHLFVILDSAKLRAALS